MGADAPTVVRQRGYALQYATVAWNLVEFGVTVVLGVTAGSVALVAFGLDSLVEVFASAVVIWHLRQPDVDDGRRRIRLALRLVAVAFALLAVALLAGSARSLWSEARPESSPAGIAYLAVTAVVMFGLARMKRTAGTRLANEPLLREAEMTRIDGWLACDVLAALAVNGLALLVVGRPAGRGGRRPTVRSGVPPHLDASGRRSSGVRPGIGDTG